MIANTETRLNSLYKKLRKNVRQFTITHVTSQFKPIPIKPTSISWKALREQYMALSFYLPPQGPTKFEARFARCSDLEDDPQ